MSAQRRKPLPRYYTTTIGATQTIAAMGELLTEYGARSYGWETNPETREPIAVHFVVSVDGIGEVPVRIEAKVDAIARRLAERSSKRAKELRQRAVNIAWRQVSAYVEMMLEMVENGLKPFHEAFMSDVMIPHDGTYLRVGDAYRIASGRLALPSKIVDAEVIE